jgi:hypothetical protein
MTIRALCRLRHKGAGGVYRTIEPGETFSDVEPVTAEMLVAAHQAEWEQEYMREADARNAAASQDEPPQDEPPQDTELLSMDEQAEIARAIVSGAPLPKGRRRARA